MWIFGFTRVNRACTYPIILSSYSSWELLHIQAVVTSMPKRFHRLEVATNLPSATLEERQEGGGFKAERGAAGSCTQNQRQRPGHVSSISLSPVTCCASRVETPISRSSWLGAYTRSIVCWRRSPSAWHFHSVFSGGEAAEQARGGYHRGRVPDRIARRL